MYFLPPGLEVIHGHFFGGDVADSRLDDGHADLIKGPKHPHGLDGAQGVKSHLAVALCRDFNSFSVLKVADLKNPVRDDQTVTGAEALRYIL